MRNIKKYPALVAFGLLSSAPLGAQNYEIATPHASLVLKAPTGGELRYAYFGQKLATADLAAINSVENCKGPAYPAYGLDCPSEVALALTHADGNMSTELEIVAVEPATSDKASAIAVKMKDKAYPLYVTVHYKAYKDVDMFETWTEIRNEEKKPVLLTQYASAALPFRRGDVWLSSLYGGWANEGRVCTERLMPGTKIVQNKDGVRNSQTAHAEVMLSLDGSPQENAGNVIGAALCYSGNYRLRLQTDESNYHTLYAGINEDNSACRLRSGETFTTPVLAFTWSAEGLSGASRNFHRWGRQYKLQHGDRLRKILLNSWEGVYFGITQEKMDNMMSDIASMGGELFVMDDGWFGAKYPRNNGSSSLGDWTVDRKKLPEGIDGLLKSAEKNSIKFGIWIEPEMTNTQSELFEKHPDWVIKAPRRELVTGRGGTQLVLDLANPAVQDHVFNVVNELLEKYPDIDYIKWDANMSLLNHGSQYLSSADQNHLYLGYHRGFEAVCKRIRERYPDLTIQACAAGGGRVNWGVLPWFDEFWTSDNTDALQRVYIQWGTSYFFPALAMGAHISASPNHQTGRQIPLKYRIDVAMSGRLGMEIQPANMTEEEKTQCRKAIADYKTIRPVVQMGDIYRLLSPYDRKGAASLMYVSEEKDKAAYFWWKTEHFAGQSLPRVKMAGLDPGKIYRVSELNRTGNRALPFEGKTFSGAFLTANGLDIARGGEYASCVLLLEAVN